MKTVNVERTTGQPDVELALHWVQNVLAYEISRVVQRGQAPVEHQ
jgi:hypothetical protein